MTLVICANESLDTLEAWATQHFCQIKGKQGKLKPPIDAPLYRSQDLGKLLHIEPHKHVQKLIISFAYLVISRYYFSSQSI